MEQKTNKYIIDVTPAIRLPFSRQQFFSYLHETKLKPGTLVSVPLFRHDVEGIVLRSRPDFEHTGGFKLKKVTRVQLEDFMTESQLNLAEQLSNHYLTSLGVILKHFMPKRVHARESSLQKLATNHQLKEIKLTPDQISAVNEIIGSNLKPDSHFEIQNSKFLLHGPASSGKTEVYIHSILKLRKENPDLQFLILLPELTLTPQALERYRGNFSSKEIVLLHSKLPKGQYYENWKKIQSGKAKLIIATRIGIFAPFQRLGMIVVDEEQDMSYKQWDMNPRYDARLGAEMLSQIFNCPIVFGTATPRIETYQRTQKSELKLLQIPVLPKQIMGREKLQPDIELVDMRKERWTDFNGKKKPNFSLLSNHLQAEISFSFANNMQTILFINHQGMSSFSVCSNCKEVLKCPKCDRALVYDESGIYKCLHCNYTSDIIPSCKACGNPVFQNIGMGTQSVVREIKKLFPRARVERLDTAAIKKPGFQEKVFNEFSEGKIDILIGTQMITKGWDNPNVGLVAIIDCDSLFSFPDYLTDERAFANIMQVIGRTGRVGSSYPGKAIIQTFNPVNPIFSYIVSRNFEGFFKKEIHEREGLSYPPFGKLVKLVYQDADPNKAETESQKIYALLQKAADGNNKIRITEPSKPLVSKVRGKNRVQIIIKSKQVDFLPKDLCVAIGSLSSSWIVDVNPISIA